MTYLAAILLAASLVLAAATALILSQARTPERSGELRVVVRGTGREHVVRRADDPERFAIELRFLRSAPWFAGALLAVTVLLFGITS